MALRAKILVIFEEKWPGRARNLLIGELGGEARVALLPANIRRLGAEENFCHLCDAALSSGGARATEAFIR